MNKPIDKLAVSRRDDANLPPINRKTMSPTAPCSAIDMAAAWTAHLAGVAIVLAAIAGLTGYRREWVSSVMAAWPVVTPALLGWGLLHSAHKAMETLTRDPALLARAREGGERR